MLPMKIRRGLKDPIGGLRFLETVMNGFYYKAKYILFNKRVKIGKNFRVRHRLSIKGPGRVIIGENVFVNGGSHTVTPWTYSKDATILIGNNVFLNGTRFGCKSRIEIGDDCILADCRILDTDFHSVLPERRNDPAAIKSEPIKIGKNVWIALDSVVLRGVEIGTNSTITAKSVVIDNVPEYCVYGGNPAVLIKELSREL